LTDLTFVVGKLLEVFIVSFVYCYNKVFLFQNWGDYVNISQTVVLYVLFASDVFLICWFGTQLTQHVRVNGLLLLLLFLQWHVAN